jgi:hypothetical protein
VKQFLIFVATLSLSWGCVRNDERKVNVKDLKVWDSLAVKYTIKDTTSTLYVRHAECTECLDAYVDSGAIYVPEQVAWEIVKLHKEKHGIPGHDLYLTGGKFISYHMFIEEVRDGNAYKISGKVIGADPLGFVFYVDSYEVIGAENKDALAK